MFIEERLDKIIEYVRKEGRLSVHKAMEICGVSADTTRRDFKQLAQRGIVSRVHGGIISQYNKIIELDIFERSKEHPKEKALIGLKASSLINDSDTIILDAGTTTIEITKNLGSFGNLTVLTYSLDIAGQVIKYPDITTIIVGGILRNPTQSIVGPDAINMIRSLSADKLFLAVNAFSIENGLMTPSRMEAEVKTCLMEIAKEIILVSDSSKINRMAMFKFGKLDQISSIVTDNKIDTSIVKKLERKNIEVHIAKP